MSEITPEEDAFMRSLYRQLEDSGIGIEPWTDQELEEHLERFRERMRHMHDDPAEGARIDAIVADATGPRSIGGEMLLAKLAEPAPEPGWSVPDPCWGESHWIEGTGYPACGLRMFYGGVRHPAPLEAPCAECVPLSLRGPRALDGQTNLTSRGRNGQMTQTASNGWTWDAESQRWVVRRGTILVTARYPEDLAPEINAALFAAQMAGGEVCALPHWLLSVIRTVDAHLDAETAAEYRDQPLAGHWSRITKVCAEGGEVMEALSLATGENPRKGTAGSWDDVLAELGDTLGAAAFAIQHITKDPAATEAVIIAAFMKAARRVAEHEERVIAGR